MKHDDARHLATVGALGKCDLRYIVQYGQQFIFTFSFLHTYYLVSIYLLLVLSVGCAFVTFASRACALNAIKAMHHSQTMEVCVCICYCCLAGTAEEKTNNLFSF